MADTQWPRYQVFLQERAGAPHQDVGSVHAPDPELALLNARDVFARRPECFNLWVVPAASIYSKTAEELQEDMEPGPAAEREPELYCVFCKAKSAGTQTYLGQVQAASPQGAMRQAVAQFSGGEAPFAWWVFPERLIVQSDPEDVPSMFAPAGTKSFRLSTDFKTHSAMQKLKKGQ